MKEFEKAAPLDFDTLLSVDIRLGKVMEVERIPKAAKFLKLTVDFGEENNRTVVTNLGKQFTPEEFQDKVLPFVMNLEPRPVAGIISEAMILASCPRTGEAVYSLLVSEDGKPGDLVL